MKVLKFLIGFAAAYVSLWIFFAGLGAIWTFCLGLDFVVGWITALCIFVVLPGLLLAWLIFDW